MSYTNSVNITNINGTGGKIETSDGMSIDLKPPVIENPSDQLTPMHLIGMAWSACLNSTIESIFESNKIENRIRIRVQIEAKRNREQGYHYILTAYVAIEAYDEKETLKVARHAHRLCPISKLIAKNEFVSLAYEAY